MFRGVRNFAATSRSLAKVTFAMRNDSARAEMHSEAARGVITSM